MKYVILEKLDLTSLILLLCTWLLTLFYAGVVVTRTSTLVYPLTLLFITQMTISTCSIALQRFLFTPPPQSLSQGRREKLMEVRCKAGAVPLMKQSHKFLSSLSSPALAGDPSATNRHIKKFVAASPKSVSLNVLSHLLSPHTSLPHLSFFALSVSLTSSFFLSLSLSQLFEIGFLIYFSCFISQVIFRNYSSFVV